MHRGFTAGNLHHVGMALVADDGVQHLFNQRQVAKLLALWPARRVAHRTAEVAVVANLHQRQAGVLLVIRTQAAVVRASPLHWRVIDQRHFRRLDEDFPAAPVVVHVVGDEHALVAVLWAALQEINVAILENSLGLDFAVAPRADGNRDVVKEVRSDFFTHEVSSQKSRVMAKLH